MMLRIKNILLATIFICFSIVACSNGNNTANIQKQKPPCDCAKSYDELVKNLELNYIGLALIRNTEKYREYEALKEKFALRAKSQTAQTCTQFLMKFLSFFEDGHLYVIEYPKYRKEVLEEQQLFLSKNRKTREEITEMLLDTSDVLTGKWSNGESVFAIVKNDSVFDGYLIKSNKEDAETGSLKLRLSKAPEGYEGSYYPFNFNTKYVRVNLYKENGLLKLNMGGSKRRWVRAGDEKVVSSIEEPKISRIDDVHTVLTIPTFGMKPKDFKKFLTDNKKTLKNTKHLIIDIRGNTGGNTIYFPLIKYFATRTLTSRQGYVLASSDNRAYFENFIGFGRSKIYSPLIERMARDGEIVDGPVYPDRKFGKTNNKIDQVSILTDKGCKSAAESFVLHAKGASNKVRTFGTPTGGVIDYTSTNSILLKNSGSQNIIFAYPTGTLHKNVLEKGYNKTGILPDVHLPSNTENLIQVVINYYNDGK